MNIGTRLILSAALAVGSTIGAAALGQTSVRDSPADVAPPTTEGDRSTGSDPSTGSEPSAAFVTATTTDAVGTDTVGTHSVETDAAISAGGASDPGGRVDGVRAELLAAAEAGEISWAAAERVSEDLGTYIRGERRADAI